jgi:hypothetical protein
MFLDESQVELLESAANFTYVFFCTKSELSFDDYRRNVGRDHVNYGYSSVARNF